MVLNLGARFVSGIDIRGGGLGAALITSGPTARMTAEKTANEADEGSSMIVDNKNVWSRDVRGGRGDGELWRRGRTSEAETQGKDMQPTRRSSSLGHGMSHARAN